MVQPLYGPLTAANDHVFFKRSQSKIFGPGGAQQRISNKLQPEDFAVWLFLAEAENGRLTDSSKYKCAESVAVEFLQQAFRTPEARKARFAWVPHSEYGIKVANEIFGLTPGDFPAFGVLQVGVKAV